MESCSSTTTLSSSLTDAWLLNCQASFRASEQRAAAGVGLTGLNATLLPDRRTYRHRRRTRLRDWQRMIPDAVAAAIPGARFPQDLIRL